MPSESTTRIAAQVLVPFWVLWLCLAGLILGLTKVTEVSASRDAQRLKAAFASNLRWAFRSNIPPTKAAAYFVSESQSILIQYVTPDPLPERFRAILTNAYKRISAGTFSTDDAKLLTDDLTALFEEYQLGRSRVVSSYRRFFKKLAGLLLLYQVAVLLLTDRMRRNGLDDLSLASEGFFNAVDLSLITALCTFFFQEDSPLSYLLFLAYVYHMVLFGATLGRHSGSITSPIVLYLALIYTISILVPVSVAAIFLQSPLFLLGGLVSIPLSVILGFTLRRYGGLSWLAQYLSETHSHPQLQST